MQKLIESWFNEVDVKFYFDDLHHYVFYKGFKISRCLDNGLYEILDTRFSDFYTEVSLSDIEVFTINGFIKGCDIINYHRNTTRISQLYKSITNLKNKLENLNNIKFNITNLNLKKNRLKRSIIYCLDLLQMYNIKNKQFKIKYNYE